MSKRTEILKLIIVHLFFIFISFLIISYNLGGPNLIWNMFLALAALDLSVLAYSSSSRIIFLIAAILWFFFYPNTFYMLTDIVHMKFVSEVLYERESMIMFMLYIPSILFGVFSGVLSINYIFDRLKVKFTVFRYVLYIAISIFSSLAIHIGRYARLNSWDIFTQPKVVIDELLAVVNIDSLPFILGFIFIQFMCLTFMDLGHVTPRNN